MATKTKEATAKTRWGHAWLCSAAVVIGGIGTIARRWINKPKFAERYVPCEFSSADFDEAYNHADKHAGSHWVYEHPNGDRSAKPSRSMHGSDGGGAYIDDFQGKWYPPDRDAAGAWF